MSSKISALPFASTVSDSDLLVIVQTAANKRTTRQQLFASAASEQMSFTSGSAGCGINNNGEVVLSVASGKKISLLVNGQVVFEVDAGGTVTVSGTAGGQANLSANGGLVNVDAAGNVALIPNAGQTVGIGYTPGAAGNWNVAPTDLLIAVDRLAAAVAGLLGGPIP
jgi:hypothetical protein